MSKMKLSEELKWRGFVNQTTLKDIRDLDKRNYKLYFGVDPSSSSMTVGNLASAMMVKTFLRHGHDVTLLVGGATGMIGDPSGKNEERKLLTTKEVAENKKIIIEQYHKLFGLKVRLVDNYDWFKNINYLEFLRDVGKHFSLTPLLQRDFVVSRIGEQGTGISYAEFSYTLIQGYDFYHLFKEYGVELQLCGGDQWGNGLSGIELIRRKTGKEANIYSMPLIINKSTGKKFGKSEGGAIWLDSSKTSVYQFYQFWLNVDDDSVGEYLKIFTELDKPNIALIMSEFENNKAGRHAQKTLAYEVTKLVHGKDKAYAVKRTTETLFGDGDYTKLSHNDLIMLKGELPVTHAKLDQTSLIEILINSGLAKSNSEARRYLIEGAIYINGQQVKADKIALDQQDDIHGHVIIRRGKNSQAIVQLTT